MVARAWGFISIYLFVPLYLKLLGIDAYGLVGFYSTLLGILAFADMGFSATLNREMARLSVREDSADEMRDLLRTYELTYFYISSFLAFAIWVSSPLIAEYWLRSAVLSVEEITSAIRLMGIAIAFQLPSGLYIGGLMGLQKQVQANFIQIAWGVFRGGGTVLALWLFSPTIYVFALLQVMSNCIYCYFARQNLWRALSFDAELPRPKFTWKVFRNTWHYAAGMAGMALVSTLLMQTDKLVVSKMLSLEMLGYYTLAGALSVVPLMLASPIASAVFPRLTGLVAEGDRTGFTQLYHRTCELVAVAIIPAGLTIVFFSSDCIFVWTGSAITAQRAGFVAAILLLGQLLQAITIVPYYLALAHGDVRLNLQIGIFSVVLITPLLIFLVMSHGIVGAGFSWLLMNICTLPPYMYFLHRRFLPGELLRWCKRGVGRPLFASLPCILVARWLVPHTDSRLLTFCFLGLVFVISTTVTVVITPQLRNVIVRKVYVFLGVSYGA